jgi:hypothetical protein
MIGLLARTRAPQPSWQQESAAKDRLIGKMLRLVSQFVIAQPVEGAALDAGGEVVMEYVRGNRAVVHTNDFLK